MSAAPIDRRRPRDGEAPRPFKRRGLPGAARDDEARRDGAAQRDTPGRGDDANQRGVADSHEADRRDASASAPARHDAARTRGARPDRAPAEAAKTPLRADVYETVLARIVSGELAPGSRIVESRLAGDLGLSRTPLREALFRLEQEGFVRADLARGFSVTPLTARDVRELYPILGALEVCALRTLGMVAIAAVPELEKLNAELAATDPKAAHAAGSRTDAVQRTLSADDRWHETLIGRCPNHRLMTLIRQHRHAISRYEHVYWQDVALVPVSVAQHRAIADALSAANIDAAVQLLDVHWRHGLEALLIRIGEP